jgi:hypothetical protein
MEATNIELGEIFTVPESGMYRVTIMGHSPDVEIRNITNEITKMTSALILNFKFKKKKFKYPAYLRKSDLPHRLRFIS